MTIEDRASEVKDKIKGKTNEVVGKMRGDKRQELKGDFQQARADLKHVVNDVKDEMKKDEP